MACARYGIFGSVVTLSCVAVVLVSSSFTLPRAALSGAVRDSEGGVISGAYILVHWDQSGSSAGLKDNVGIKKDLTLKTDQRGEFTLEIPPGFYDVFVSAPAFSPEGQKVRIKSGQTALYKVVLKADPLVTKELGDRFSVNDSLTH